jgi:hypothetical protein
MEDREMCPERQLTRVSVKDNFTGLEDTAFQVIIAE